MQKNRKLISVLLAMVMMLSVISAGFVAAAQEANGAKDAVVTALEKKINAFDGDMNTATPKDEDKAAYDALVADFQKLTGEQKDSIDAFALDKLTQLMYNYWRAVNGTGYSQRKDAAKFVVETLDCPAINEAAAAAAAGITSAKTDKAIELYKGLSSELARIMVGTAYSSYGLFYESITVDSNYTNSAMHNLVNKIWSDLKKADPFKGKTPSYKDYEGGLNDPQYVADYRAYYNEKYTHETNVLKKAVAQAGKSIGLEKFSKISTYMDLAIEAAKAFEANKDYKKAAEADKFYNSLDFETQYAIRGIRCIAHCNYDGKSETATSPNTVYLSKLPELISSYAQYESVIEFEKYIAKVNEPYTVKVALEAFNKYQTVPNTLRSSLSDTAKQKIDALTYIVLTQNPSQEKPDLSGYNKTNITYPNGITKEQTLEALPKMNALVNEIVSSVAGANLKTLITDGLYTNEAIANIQKKIGPMLGTLGINGNVNPSGLLPYIATKNGDNKWVSNYSPKWDGAVAALEKVANDTDNWDDVVYKNGDWFTDGDRQGFADAFGVILMESYNLKMIINVGQTLFNSLQFENKYDFDSATYKTGSYENIVHIFEAIGIPCTDSVTYTENFNAQTNDTDRMIARISPIVYDLFTFVEQFAVTPVTTLSEILPNVAYALNNGIINENVHAIIDRISGLLGMAGVTLPTLDFTAEGIFDTLGGLGIEGITYEQATNSAGQPVKENDGTLYVNIALNEETTTTLAISEKAFIKYLKDVEGCGKLTADDSICVNNAYKPYIVSDKADTFVTTVRFIYDDVLLKNKDSLKQIITVANETVGTIVGPVLDVMAKYLPADSVIVALVNLSNPQVPDINIGGGEEGGIAGFIQKLIDLIMSFFNPEDPTNPDNPDNPGNNDNPSIPNTTSGKIIAPIVVMAVLGGIGAGAAACVNKCKKDDEE